jgi:hypothetical protein
VIIEIALLSSPFQAGTVMSNPVRTSGKAKASLILGIATLILGFWTAASRSLPVFILAILACVIALIFGIVGRREVAKNELELHGKGLAGWGIGLSIAGPALGLALATFG